MNVLNMHIMKTVTISWCTVSREKTYNWVRSLDFGVNRICLNRKCIKVGGCKDPESIQSRTTPDQGYHMGK